MAVVTTQIQAKEGFTLLETLVVIAIIAVMAGLIVLSVSGNEGKRLQAEAERLQQITQMAADEAIFQKAELGMVFTEHSYRFLRYDNIARNWKELNDKPFRAYILPADILVALTEGNQSVLLPETDEKIKTLPSIVFYSSGEMTAFNLTLSTPSADDPVKLVADGIAPIVLDRGSKP